MPRDEGPHLINQQLRLPAEPLISIEFGIFLYAAPIVDDTLRRVAITTVVDIDELGIYVEISKTLLTKHVYFVGVIIKNIKIY